MKRRNKTAKARQLKETNPKVLRIYYTGQIENLTPVRKGKRGAKKPKKKDHR
jgi:hypothetical protein